MKKNRTSKNVMEVKSCYNCLKGGRIQMYLDNHHIENEDQEMCFGTVKKLALNSFDDTPKYNSKKESNSWERQTKKNKGFYSYISLLFI